MGTRSPSIHYLRRWYYVLWSSLLIASICLWILWRIPAKSGEATLCLHLRIGGIPAGTKVEVWAGPRVSWMGMASGTPSQFSTEHVPPDGQLRLTRPLPVAYRRWVGNCIPERTTDLVILVFQPLEGPVRHFTLSLDKDWGSGVLQPGRKMSVTVDGNWKGLSTRLWPRQS